jgi:hypothetical protein
LPFILHGSMGIGWPLSWFCIMKFLRGHTTNEQTIHLHELTCYHY